MLNTCLIQEWIYRKRKQQFESDKQSSIHTYITFDPIVSFMTMKCEKEKNMSIGNMAKRKNS
ncbi:hypothetical protein BSK33_15580 [Geobacillus sp. 44B]|nr:hypothetical protein BSK33_15580 [Geobacillus sp. 44B]